MSTTLECPERTCVVVAEPLWQARPWGCLVGPLCGSGQALEQNFREETGRSTPGRVRSTTAQNFRKQYRIRDGYSLHKCNDSNLKTMSSPPQAKKAKANNAF